MCKCMNYYFLGIGGIGMSALARYFHLQGHQVSGYDRTPSPLTQQLEAEGIPVHYNDDPALIPEAVDLVVYTPAVPVETAEYQHLLQKGVPIKKRSQVLGEVTRPGRYRIDRDEFTIFDALSLAGDLTINGLRQNVALVRDYGTDKERVFTMDLTKSTGIYSSPAYYIQQGDLIYVTPNKKKLRESTVIGNTTLTPSFWISLVSSVTSIAVSLAVLMSK